MELKGTGFSLREWRKGDVVSLQKHADNININSYLLDRFPNPYTTKAARSWIALMLIQKPQVNFAIDVRGFAIGVIGLDLREDVYRKAPLLGYWLSETFWGRGIMTEAIKIIVDYGFNNLDIVRIQAGVLSNNPRSMRVLEKAGFVKEGILKQGIIKNGVILDEHIYGLVKDQQV
jgi:[ribosomal protein S5]-alanine N-acetyltransferase